MHIYNDLIGFRPGSGVGSRLMKHPERLRSGSPASSSELPPIRKLSSLVSRPPTFAPPIRDVSLREETPRAYDDSMRTIDDETASLSTTKEFDGRAVDPGNHYEWASRTTFLRLIVLILMNAKMIFRSLHVLSTIILWVLFFHSQRTLLNPSQRGCSCSIAPLN